MCLHSSPGPRSGLKEKSFVFLSQIKSQEGEGRGGRCCEVASQYFHFTPGDCHFLFRKKGYLFKLKYFLWTEKLVAITVPRARIRSFKWAKKSSISISFFSKSKRTELPKCQVWPLCVVRKSVHTRRWALRDHRCFTEIYTFSYAFTYIF